MDITLFVLLLVASAFFSASETAFLSLDKIRIKQIEKTGRIADYVASLASDMHKLLVTVLIGNTFVNIAASAVLTGVFYRVVGERSVGLSIAVMAIVILIFGEVTPKMFALSNGEKVAFHVAVPLRMIEILLKPIRLVVSGIAFSVIRCFGVKISHERQKITEQDIRFMFLLGKKKGIVKEREKNMIDSILEFKELNAADIMTPRINIVALDLSLERTALVKKIKENHYSRLPAYVHTLDNVVGIIHSKDILLGSATPTKNLIRRGFFAPESMKIDDLLQQLQKAHTHMAVITDEYGVTSGIVTIEDILEEIVGEIKDEFDIEAPKIRKISQNSYEIKGQTHIDEVNEITGLSIQTEEVDTIGGYVILRMGRIPRAGDKMRIGNMLVTVKDVSKNRITNIVIEKDDKETGLFSK